MLNGEDVVINPNPEGFPPPSPVALPVPAVGVAGAADADVARAEGQPQHVALAVAPLPPAANPAAPLLPAANRGGDYCIRRARATLSPGLATLTLTVAGAVLNKFVDFTDSNIVIPAATLLLWTAQVGTNVAAVRCIDPPSPAENNSSWFKKNFLCTSVLGVISGVSALGIALANGEDASVSLAAAGAYGMLGSLVGSVVDNFPLFRAACRG